MDRPSSQPTPVANQAHREHIGPREPGGTYRDSGHGQNYVVQYILDTGYQPLISVTWDDGTHDILTAPWKYYHDAVVTQPDGQIGLGKLGVAPLQTMGHLHTARCVYVTYAIVCAAGLAMSPSFAVTETGALAALALVISTGLALALALVGIIAIAIHQQLRALQRDPDAPLETIASKRMERLARKATAHIDRA